MNNKHKYAREKLRNAVYLLATGEGDVRSRLRRVYRHIRGVNPGDVPSDMKRDLQWVKNEMVKFGPLVDRYGVVLDAHEHTMRRIRNSTGKKIAERIYSMKSKLHLK